MPQQFQFLSFMFHRVFFIFKLQVSTANHAGILAHFEGNVKLGEI